MKKLFNSKLKSKIIRIFRPVVSITTKNPTPQMLNKLREFKIIETKTKGDSVEITLPLVHKKRVISALGKNSYLVKNRLGALLPLSFLYSRATLGIGLCVVFLGVIFFSGMIFRINISGIDGEERAKVAKFLGESGVRTVRRINPSEELAIAVTNEFDFVAHTSVSRRGNTLNVNVYRAEMPPQFVIRDIVSPREAVITTMAVLSGIGVVRVGDVVTTGQKMVEASFQMGAVPIGPNEVGQMQYDRIVVPAVAAAIIWGRVAESSVKTVATEAEIENAKETLKEEILAMITKESRTGAPAREPQITSSVVQTADGFAVEVVITHIITLACLDDLVVQ